MGRKANELTAIAKAVDEGLQKAFMLVDSLESDLEEKDKQILKLQLQLKAEKTKNEQLEKTLGRKERTIDKLNIEKRTLLYEIKRINNHQLANTKENRKRIGKVVAWLRNMSGMSQREYGALFYETQQNVQKLESGFYSVERTFEHIEAVKKANEKELIYLEK
jgi:predicted RNase H-like nuclease (RuvC/YqgF family)